MISINNLVENVELYKVELKKRNMDISLAEQTKQAYSLWKQLQQDLDNLRQQKNQFNNVVVNMSGEEKSTKIAEMKVVSAKIKQQEEVAREARENLDDLVAIIPNLSWQGIPEGETDADNPLINTWGDKPQFEFEARPYWELEVYKKYTAHEEGVKAMGARGYYLRGELARFRKVLFDWAEDLIYKQGFEMFYPPLMLNEKVMTDIGNLPDFGGDLYEVNIDENKSYYLIPSSEQSMMGYWMGKNVGDLYEPLLMMANTTCFRKEAGSYGKDQQGILRVHQFEKIEIDAIYKPEDEDKVFGLMNQICQSIYNQLGLYFRAVEICSGDLPKKHYRQIDYEAYFPGVDKFREIASNGAATDYQNRGLKITYGEKQLPWSNNCTGIVFRTGLAILEQFQQADGRVRIPEVLQSRFGKEYLE
ncbi:MAG: serine--tRNA ligase [Patescibacteria group bacterium]